MLDFHHIGLFNLSHIDFDEDNKREGVGCDESKENFLKFSPENFPNLKLNLLYCFKCVSFNVGLMVYVSVVCKEQGRL